MVQNFVPILVDFDTKTVTTPIPVPTIAQFQDSLRRAREVGTRILYTIDGFAYATSSSFTDRLYRVGFAGCECTGFRHRGRCAHYAAFLREAIAQ